MDELISKGFELYEQTEDYTRFKKQIDKDNWYQIFIYTDRTCVLEECHTLTDDSYFSKIIYEGNIDKLNGNLD